MSPVTEQPQAASDHAQEVLPDTASAKTPKFPDLPPPLRIVAEIPAVQRARSLRVRAMLVVIGVVFLPFVFVSAAAGFDIAPAELLRLTVAVVPVAIIVGWWLGWRMVRPIENLREQVLSRTIDAGSQAELDLRRSDEFGNLAAAFNTLLTRLDERNEANVAFAADLAHEFKNPVAAIRACAETLSSGDVNAQRAARIAAILEGCSGRLDRLVTQLLEVARAEAGMAGEKWETVDIAELVKGVVANVSQDERWTMVQFSINCTGPAPVLGVSGGLETALRNLVVNAASFNIDGGHVEVEIETIEERVIVSVKDSGPGISAEDLPHVFDRFFTTRGGTKKGTGLGLALVRAVAQAHRGTVTVESVPGEWTRFEMRLWRESSP